MTQEFWLGMAIPAIVGALSVVWIIIVLILNRNPESRRGCLTAEERVVLSEAVHKHRQKLREENLKYINDLLTKDKGWDLLSDAEVQSVYDAFHSSMYRRYDW